MLCGRAQHERGRRGLSCRSLTYRAVARFVQVSEASRAMPMAQFKPVAPALQVRWCTGGRTISGGAQLGGPFCLHSACQATCLCIEGCPCVCIACRSPTFSA